MVFTSYPVKAASRLVPGRTCPPEPSAWTASSSAMCCTVGPMRQRHTIRSHSNRLAGSSVTHVVLSPQWADGSGPAARGGAGVATGRRELGGRLPGALMDAVALLRCHQHVPGQERPSPPRAGPQVGDGDGALRVALVVDGGQAGQDDDAAAAAGAVGAVGAHGGVAHAVVPGASIAATIRASAALVSQRST